MEFRVLISDLISWSAGELELLMRGVKRWTKRKII